MASCPKIGLLLCLAAELCAFSAKGAEPYHTVLLVASPDTEERIGKLASFLDAHMSDLDTRALIETLDAMPEDRDAQHRLASDLARRNHPLAVVWICPFRNELLLISGEGAFEDVLIEDISLLGKDPEAASDKMATLIRSSLTPWLEQSSAPLTRKPVISIKALSRPRPVSPKSTLVTLSAGYALVAQDGVSSMVNGADIAMGVGFGAGFLSHLDFHVGVRLLQLADIPIEGRDARLWRFPVLFGAGLFWSWKSLDIGARAGMIVDIARVKGVSENSAPDDTGSVRLGVAPSVFARYRITRLLGAWLDLGVDVFGKTYHYRWDDESVYRNGNLQPRGALGLSILLCAAGTCDKRGANPRHQGDAP